MGEDNSPVDKCLRLFIPESDGSLTKSIQLVTQLNRQQADRLRTLPTRMCNTNVAKRTTSLTDLTPSSAVRSRRNRAGGSSFDVLGGRHASTQIGVGVNTRGREGGG